MPTDRKEYMREYQRQRRAKLKEYGSNPGVSSQRTPDETTSHSSGIWGWILFALIMGVMWLSTKHMTPDELIAFSKRHKLSYKGATHQYA